MAAQVPEYETEEAFFRRPESQQRVELLDGEVVVSPSATPLHQRLILRLARRLEDLGFEERVYVSPLDVRLGVDRVLQPDVVIFAEPIDLRVRPVQQRPLVCVEVVSPSNAIYDRHVKRLVYADAGVPEYWVVDPDARRVEVFHGPGLVARQLVMTDLVSATLELTADVSTWW